MDERAREADDAREEREGGERRRRGRGARGAGAGAGVAAVVAAFASVPGRLHLGSHAVAIAACGTVLARGGMGKRGRARAKTE